MRGRAEGDGRVAESEGSARTLAGPRTGSRICISCDGFAVRTAPGENLGRARLANGIFHSYAYRAATHLIALCQLTPFSVSERPQPPPPHLPRLWS